MLAAQTPFNFPDDLNFSIIPKRSKQHPSNRDQQTISYTIIPKPSKSRPTPHFSKESQCSYSHDSLPFSRVKNLQAYRQKYINCKVTNPMQNLIKLLKRTNRSLNGFAPRKFLIKILQYISAAMGKKLRTRQIEDITDEDANIQCPFDLPSAEIDLCSLRKLILKKNEKKSLKHEQKTRRFKHRLATAQFDQIISETAFECSICLELMVAPTMMLCGHMFCHKCLESSNVYNQNCSLCRRSQDQEQFVLNPTAQRIIHQFILPRTDNFLGYLCRMTDSEEWGKRRKIGNVRVNQIIDFQDTLNIWRKGTVVAVSKENQVLMARVKITIKGDDFFETVEANSRRIAPFTFFTKKKYLQDFVPSLAQYQPKQLVQLQLPYRDVQVTQECDYWPAQSPSEMGQSAYPFSLYQQRAEDSLEQEMKLFHYEMDQHHLFL